MPSLMATMLRWRTHSTWTKMDNSIPQEKMSRRKMSLKAVYQGGRTLVRGRHHQSCPDLSMDMVDCLDRNTCHFFWDNKDHDIVNSELIELYLE